MKTAYVTGSDGQIGSVICEKLLSKGYFVYGLSRSTFNKFISHANLKTICGDITDFKFITESIKDTQPDLFFNCASQSNIVVSFQDPSYTKLATGHSVSTCLEAIKKFSGHTRFITLGSSAMFGSSPPNQNETTPFDPCSPYAEAKLIAYQAVLEYRSKGIFASNVICFNTESPRRPIDYVTRKITSSAAKIKLGLQDKLLLGNLNSKRDFSHAKDVADGIVKILASDKPNDFVVASEESHSIQEFVELVFARLNLNWQDHVVIDQKFFRDVDNVYCGDASKIKCMLGWTPKYKFQDLVNEMTDFDLNLIGKEMK